MQVRFYRAVERDLAEARDYYDRVSIFAGDRFLTEVETTIQTIARRPESFSPIRNGDGKRRALLQRYPYTVVFRFIEPDIVQILCIKYSRRHPDHGMDRE